MPVIKSFGVMLGSLEAMHLSTRSTLHLLTALLTASLTAGNMSFHKTFVRKALKIKNTGLSLPLVDVKDKVMEENTVKGKAGKYYC